MAHRHIVFSTNRISCSFMNKIFENSYFLLADKFEKDLVSTTLVLLYVL